MALTWIVVISILAVTCSYGQRPQYRNAQIDHNAIGELNAKLSTWLAQSSTTLTQRRSLQPAGEGKIGKFKHSHDNPQRAKPHPPSGKTGTNLQKGSGAGRIREHNLELKENLEQKVKKVRTDPKKEANTGRLMGGGDTDTRPGGPLDSKSPPKPPATKPEVAEVKSEIQQNLLKMRNRKDKKEWNRVGGKTPTKTEVQTRRERIKKRAQDLQKGPQARADGVKGQRKQRKQRNANHLRGNDRSRQRRAEKADTLKMMAPEKKENRAETKVIRKEAAPPAKAIVREDKLLEKVKKLRETSNDVTKKKASDSSDSDSKETDKKDDDDEYDDDYDYNKDTDNNEDYDYDLRKKDDYKDYDYKDEDYEYKK